MKVPDLSMVARLIPQLPGLRLEHFEIAAETITISLSTTAPTANCPLCGTSSSHIHCSYSRAPADLPWSGYGVHLQLTVRKFFCKFAACARRIFTERLPDLVASYARRTTRLAQIVGLIAFALGGQAGARLIDRLDMPVSASTLLRCIRRTADKPVITPTVLGLDDFALRKGRIYGAILVDLEKHRPIDLLPDRTAATLAAWLQQHPHIEIISRDRSTEYIRGVTTGAPLARQIADRCHIVANLREALEHQLDRNHAMFRGIVLPGPAAAEAVVAVVPAAARRRPAPRAAAEALAWQSKRTAKQARIEQVRIKQQAGESINSIAAQMGISRSTIYRYVRGGNEPTATRTKLPPSILDPYLS